MKLKNYFRGNREYSVVNAHLRRKGTSRRGRNDKAIAFLMLCSVVGAILYLFIQWVQAGGWVIVVPIIVLVLFLFIWRNWKEWQRRWRIRQMGNIRQWQQDEIDKEELRRLQRAKERYNKYRN